MQFVCIGQDSKNSMTKRDIDQWRRETGEGVHKSDGTIIMGSLSKLLFSIVFADQCRKFVFKDLLMSKNEALAELKNFGLNAGRPGS